MPDFISFLHPTMNRELCFMEARSLTLPGLGFLSANALIFPTHPVSRLAQSVSAKRSQTCL